MVHLCNASTCAGFTLVYLAGKVRRMTLYEYYLAHGTAGLAELAQKAGTKLSYIRQLIYEPRKRPSVDMAEKIIVASENKITLHGLCNPSALAD